MSKKQNIITCSYCGAENTGDITICSKCGRIIQVNEKAPFDFRPIVAWISVVAIIGALWFVRNIWYDYRMWHFFSLWYLCYRESIASILFALMIIITTIIVLKFSEAKTFGSIYKISYIIMFVLGLIVESFDYWMTGYAFSGIINIIFAILLLALAPSILVKIIRSVRN